MGRLNFLERWIKKARIGSGETVTIDIPAQLYYKELALYTASSILANAISLSEFRVFLGGKQVKNEDYFRLNVAPNKNENSNLFWHKVIRKMVREPTGAMVVEINGELHCAESYSVMAQRPILGNLYDGVVLEGGLQLNRVFRADEIYLFRMEDETVKTLVDGVYQEYGKLLKTAARAFLDTNGRKFKLKVDGVKEGDDEFSEEYQNKISTEIKKYMENEYATYVEYEGEELKEESNNKPQKDSSDLINLRKDLFQMVGQALKIPNSLMTGDVTSVKDVCDVFLTFAVDPLADTITAVLNKRATMEEFLAGNYYKCYTGTVKHRDLFDLAPAVDKLISSSAMCTDEVRIEMGFSELNTPWSRQHYITKNYNRVEDVTKKVEGEDQIE